MGWPRPSERRRKVLPQPRCRPAACCLPLSPSSSSREERREIGGVVPKVSDPQPAAQGVKLCCWDRREAAERLSTGPAKFLVAAALPRPQPRCYGTRPSPRGEQRAAASGCPRGGGGGARSPRSAGVLLRAAVTAPPSACLRPSLAADGDGREEPPPEPAAASPERPHVLLPAPRSPAALPAVRAADAPLLPAGKR